MGPMLAQGRPLLAGRVGLRVVTVAAATGVASAIWDFTGELPTWRATYPDWDCVRATGGEGEPDWNAWRSALEVAAEEGRFAEVSGPYLPQAVQAAFLIDLDEQQTADVPCFLGALTAVVMQFLVCEGTGECPAEVVDQVAELVQRLLRHDHYHFGIKELLGTRWPILELLSVANFEGLPHGKEEEDLCSNVDSPMIPWGRLLEAYNGPDWFKDAQRWVYSRGLQANWKSAYDECLYGLSMIIFWKLSVCLRTQAECVDQYLTHFDDVLRDKGWLEIAGTPWGVFARLSEIRASVRRHEYKIDFLPQELRGPPGAAPRTGEASVAYTQAVASVAAGAPLTYAAPAEAGWPEARALLYVTMVFGPAYNQYIPRFVSRARALGIENLVLFTLDDEATASCELLLGRSRCVAGTPSILNKFTLPLVYLHLGVDVFWLDFDVFLFQDPTPFTLQRAAETGAELLVSGSFADDCICSGLVFFKATPLTRAWLSDLLSWFYEHTYAHDQQAFSAFLAGRPDVDNATNPERICSGTLFKKYLNLRPPPWALLDPVTQFVTARALNTTGWAGKAEDVVIFHILHGDSEINRKHEAHGWNRQHGERPLAAKGALMDIFYGQREEELYAEAGRPPGWSPAIEEALEESRRPERPSELLHCGTLQLKPYRPGLEDPDG